MKKFKHFTLGGIQQKILNLVLLTIVLMVVVNSAVILYQTGQMTDLVQETNESQKQSISEISGQTMYAVLDSNLTQSTQMEAYIAGTLFADAEHVVSIVADYTQKLFAEPSAYPVRTVSLPEMEKDGEISVQLLTEEGVDVTAPEVAQKLGLIGNLADLMLGVYPEANVDSCYVALPEGVMLLVDDHSGSKFDENGEIVHIPMRERLWYQGAAETGALYFTDVTTDLYTGEISIMCSLPIYQDGELVAVVGADLFLNDMSAAVNALARDGSFICIVNEKGHVLFSPQTEGTFRVSSAEDAQDIRELGNAELKAFVTDALAGSTGLRLFEVDGEPYYLAGNPIPNVGWTLLCVVPKALADQPTAAMLAQYDAIQAEATADFSENMGHSRTTVIVLIAVVFVIASVAALVLSKRIVKPLEAITKRVYSLNENDLQFRMEPEYKTGDEIEVLAESFAMLSGKTVQYISEVQRITAEKERIGAELSLATRIQADMLPNIFPAFPERTEFEIYASMDPAKEVGGDFYDFFLIDDDHLCMVMADVSGKGVPAALFMMASKIILASNAQQGKSPAQILTDTNAAICANNKEEMFVTTWLGILELSTGRLTAANAGHEYPVVKQATGDFALLKDKHGFVIGGMAGAKYKEYTLTLEAGARLFLYTDGVPEATNAEKELFGTDRMLAALNKDLSAGPEQVMKNVRGAVDAFVKDAEQFDDLTMLCLKYNGPQNA